MKKRSTCQQSPKGGRKSRPAKRSYTIGMDLGDKTSRYCVLDEEGSVVEESVATNQKAMLGTFGARPRCRIAMEVGTHSPWVSRLLSRLGYEVIVANARQVQLISKSSRKDDRLDARTLARLARANPQLLRPIRHRCEEAQQDLLVIRVRAALVDARTSLVNSARGLAKSVGERLPTCDADNLGPAKLSGLPGSLQQTLRPLLEQVETMTARIKVSDQYIEQIARIKYPETELLRQVSGVGPLIALTYVLTVDDPRRFAKSRDVGCYVGLRPKRGDSGERQPIERKLPSSTAWGWIDCEDRPRWLAGVLQSGA
ncbi:MAG TPA: IS110 family transposase [Bryobacteraceae bacterium]|nr:IS110 family transposase [Bryobacteraceae bacterium]